MKQKENQRILGKHVRVLNDSRKTNLNNNDLVVGVSGSGKTGGYVIPNLRCCQESIYVADTKGLLYKQYAKDLEQVGYKVYLIDGDYRGMYQAVQKCSRSRTSWY